MRAVVVHDHPGNHRQSKASRFPRTSISLQTHRGPGRNPAVLEIQVDELHRLEFAEGIKALLRHDPDYLMLGEIRDGVSAHTAVQAAISGRVLLSTMHSRDCVGAITALRNWGMADKSSTRGKGRRRR